MSADGMYQCKAPGRPLELTMREGYTARDLAIAYIGITCANVILPVELADRAHEGGFHGRLKPAEIEPRFRAMFEELGLVLVRKEGAAILVDQAWLVHRPGVILLRREDPALAITERTAHDAAATATATASAGADDTHRVVSRAEIEAAIAAHADAARVLPASHNGLPNGARLYAIRPRSIYARAGFANGDVVQTVNGVEVRAPDQLAIDKLFTVSHLELTLTRRGKPMTLVIDVQ